MKQESTLSETESWNGRCYEFSIKKLRKINGKPKLIIGKVFSNKEKKYINHCWVQKNNIVYDVLGQFTLKQFNQIGKPKDMAIFTKKNALKKLECLGYIDKTWKNQAKKRKVEK